MSKILLFISVAFSFTALAIEDGRICIAPSPKPGTKSFYYPGEFLPKLNYEIKIGSKDIVEVDSFKGQWVNNFSLKEKYLLSVFEEGKRVSSFNFSFTKYSKKNLCLWLYQPHNTWQLSNLRTQCKCTS